MLTIIAYEFFFDSARQVNQFGASGSIGLAESIAGDRKSVGDRNTFLF